MDVLTDDHEREQVVRKWWSENWKSITLGLVIAIGGMVGYRQYLNYQTKTATEYAYELNRLQTTLASSKNPEASEITAFLKAHEDLYGSLLSLNLASMNATLGNYDKALVNVEFASKNGGDLVAPNAMLAKAHILTQMKKYEEATKTVSAVDPKAYAVEKNELLGDIYYAQGLNDKAYDSYKLALSACEQNKIAISPILQMKADSLIKSGDTPAYKRSQALADEIAKSASEIKK